MPKLERRKNITCSRVLCQIYGWKPKVQRWTSNSKPKLGKLIGLEVQLSAPVTKEPSPDSGASAVPLTSGPWHRSRRGLRWYSDGVAQRLAVGSPVSLRHCYPLGGCNRQQWKDVIGATLQNDAVRLWWWGGKGGGKDSSSSESQEIRNEGNCARGDF